MRRFKKDPDGGLTLLIQNESPGKDKESQLASRAEGALLNGDAPLLAERRSAGRQVDHPAAEA
jgi:hypothetical protein